MYPPLRLQVTLKSTQVAADQMCVVCGRGPFKGKIGMGQHMKRAHPEEHCKSKEPSTVRSNAHWTVEEMALVVRELNSMESNLTAIKKNRRLAKAFPGRTVDSFNGLRRQPEFLQLAKEMANVVEEEEEDEDLDTPSASKLLKPSDIDKSLLFIDPQSNFEELSEIELNAFNEKEWNAWYEKLPKEKVAPRKSSRVTEGLKARKLRRHQYARVQAMFFKNRSRTAKSCIDGSWQEIGKAKATINTEVFLRTF